METPLMTAAAIDAARADAQAYLRIGETGETALIDAMAASAFHLCEAFTGRATIARDWTVVVPAHGAWAVLPVTPVLAITGVEGLPAEGAAFPLPGERYAIELGADGSGWVRVTQPGAAGRVRVTCRAGLAEEWETLPAPIRQGIVLLIAHLFTDRGAGAEPPRAVAALWRPWRRMRLGRP